jgi:structure-specific endonuclease subunit SLX1
MRYSRIFRTMISMSPFNTWPLHVKLFTHEAEQYWKDCNDVASPLPPGFTCTLELEGVDGKSGYVGSGRQGPMITNDGKLLLSISSRLAYTFPTEEFASTILAKDTVISAAGRNVECAICREPVLTYAVVSLIYLSGPSRQIYFVEQSPLSTALCPSFNLHAV